MDPPVPVSTSSLSPLGAPAPAFLVPASRPFVLVVSLLATWPLLFALATFRVSFPLPSLASRPGPSATAVPIIFIAVEFGTFAELVFHVLLDRNRNSGEESAVKVELKGS